MELMPGPASLTTDRRILRLNLIPFCLARRRMVFPAAAVSTELWFAAQMLWLFRLVALQRQFHSVVVVTVLFLVAAD